MILYNKLHALLRERGITWTEIRTRLRFSSSTVAKINKNQIVSLEVIDRLCDYLIVQPGDILEFVSEKTETELLKEYEEILLDRNIPVKEKLSKAVEYGSRIGDSIGKAYNYSRPINIPIRQSNKNKE